MSRLTRNGIAEPVSRDQILRRERGQETLVFPVQLTTSRIDNLTRSIHTLAIMCDHNIGEKPTVTLYTYINRYAGTPESHLNVLTFLSLTGGCSEGLDEFRFFSKNKHNVV